MPEEKRCRDCGAPVDNPYYWIDPDNKAHIYRCKMCLEMHWYHFMRDNDRMTLYVVQRVSLYRTSDLVIANLLSRDRAERIHWQRIQEKNARKDSLARSRGMRPSEQLSPAYRTFVTDGCAFEWSVFMQEHKNGGHNWGGCQREDCNFTDWHGQVWWGRWIYALWGRSRTNGMRIQSNEVIHCRKTKRTEEPRRPLPTRMVVTSGIGSLSGTEFLQT